MPELPEVETIARQLRTRGVEGCEILSVKVSWPGETETSVVSSTDRNTVTVAAGIKVHMVL